MEVMRKKIDLTTIYVVIAVLGIIWTIYMLFISHGEWFAQILYPDPFDTGMDFFHSIEYTEGGEPYRKYATLYPPLANLVFYVLYRFVPVSQMEFWRNAGYARLTTADFRLWQTTLFMFILFVMITSIAVIILIQKCFNEEKKQIVTGFSCCILFSAGMLYAYERGNIIILSWLLALFFVKYRNSNNKIISELALIALAISAGLKLYPAIYGVLMIYEKNYKRAFRAIIYGIVCFVLPSFAFKEGIEGIRIFFEVLLNHSANGVAKLNGYDFSGIANTVLNIINNIIGTNFQNEFGMLYNACVCLFMILLGGVYKKNWQRVLCCSVAMLLFQSQQGYGILFLSIPLIIMVVEEKYLTLENIFPFFILTLTTILLPIGYKPILTITTFDLRYQIGMAILLGYLIFIACKYIVTHIQAR